MVRIKDLMNGLIASIVTTALTLSMGASAHDRQAELGVRELPQFDGLDLSPDSSHLLMVRAAGEVYDVVVRRLVEDRLVEDRLVENQTDEYYPDAAVERVIYRGDPIDGMVNWCRWANNTRVVCSVRTYEPAPRVGQLIQTRMFAVDRDGTNHRKLIPKARSRERGPKVWNAQVQDRVINWLAGDPEHILIQLKRDAPDRAGVYRLNIYNNQMYRVQRPRSAVRRWYATHDGNVRLAIGYKNNAQPVVYGVYKQRLRRFKSAIFDSELPPTPLGFSADERYVYMSMTNGEDRYGIYKVDIDSGSVVESVFQDEDFDVFGGIIVDPQSGVPLGVRYLRDHPKLVWFAPEQQALFERVRQQLPGEQMRLVSTDSTQERFVIETYGGIAPRFYLYDRNADDLQVIGVKYPGLQDREVVDLTAIEYRARDGLYIPAYLARPEARGPHPTVLLPHGGPYVRDSAQFDAWTQLLVEEGYAVLKPNYRGSVGYGERYLQAGYRQWGMKMQEDLIDGLDWLVAQGIADPERVCVVGASFGGYSALVSAFKHADKINCAVSMAGISDLPEVARRFYEFDLGKRNRERLQKHSQLVANSPLQQADHIDVPVLLLHGNRDTVVDVEQSRDLAAALQRHGKAYRYVEQEQGDHFLSLRSQRVEFFEEMRSFLNEHLQP